jgi:hypothetical protein
MPRTTSWLQSGSPQSGFGVVGMVVTAFLLAGVGLAGYHLHCRYALERQREQIESALDRATVRRGSKPWTHGELVARIRELLTSHGARLSSEADLSLRLEPLTPENARGLSRLARTKLDLACQQLSAADVRSQRVRSARADARGERTTRGARTDDAGPVAACDDAQLERLPYSIAHLRARAVLRRGWVGRTLEVQRQYLLEQTIEDRGESGPEGE